MLLKPLAANAAQVLDGLDETASRCFRLADTEPPEVGRLCGFFDHLRQIPEFHSARGVRHSLVSVLAIAVAARIVGVHDPTAITECGARRNRHRLAAICAFRNPTTGCLTSPLWASAHHRKSPQFSIDIDTDFSCGEGRSRMCTGDLPRNLARLINAAISIVRLRG